MKTLQGIGACSGVADGPLYLHQFSVPDASEQSIGTPEEETARAKAAIATACEQLHALREQAVAEGLCVEDAGIFDIQAMMLSDADFTTQIYTLLQLPGTSAAQAVQEIGQEFADRLRALKDPFMQERSADVTDAAGRVVAILTNTQSTHTPLEEVASRVVLAVDTLLPSQTMLLDHTKICAFVTRTGGPSSHTAILLRSLGIPAALGLEDEFSALENGVRTMVDGEDGLVVQAPDTITISRFAKKMISQVKNEHSLQALKGLPATTTNGIALTLTANIALVEETKKALAQDAQGIGLFRSELLYLDSISLPDEETLFTAYRDVLLAMGTRRVVVRTLDTGAEAHSIFPDLPPAQNPAFGPRPVPLALARPQILHTQLRALLRASAYGNLCIVLPMIISHEEVKAVRAMLHEAKQELLEEGRLTKDVPLGVMIETPAAAIMADVLAQKADFLSIGTNDLTQYLLLADRQSSADAAEHNAHHPAVLRTIWQVAQAAHACGKPVCVCGECASDETLAAFFAAARVDELSMAPSCILKMKRAMRNVTPNDMRDALAAAKITAEE